MAMIVKKHYIWIDYAKFLIIFLVVFFHTLPLIYGIPGQSLLLFRMPAFFFLAGLLFRFDKYPSFIQYIIHRSKQLLVPYICLFVLLYIFWLIIGRTTGASIDTDIPYSQPIFEFLRGTPKTVGLPLWYIVCLFFIQCVFYLVFRRLKRSISTILLLLFHFIPLFINLENSPFSLDKACNGITFYGIACLYRKEIFHFIEKGNNFFAGIICLTINIFIVHVSLNIPISLELGALNLLGSFTIILSAFIFIKWISILLGKNLFIEKMASNTIVILAFHMLAVIVIQRSIMWSFHETEAFFDKKYVLKFMIALLATTSMIIPIYLINSYFPFVIGKSKDRKSPNTTKIRS